MRPVSQRFLTSLTGSHGAAFRARIVDPGQTGVSPTGTEVTILGGDVQLDGAADIRSTLELEVDGRGMWPTGSGSLLVPYGAEAFVERGIAYGGGSVEWVSLGYFRINEVEQPDAPDGPIRLSGTDRMANIIDAKLVAPVQFPATAQYEDVVDQLVTDAYAAAVIEWDDEGVAGDPIGRTALVESDRAAFLRELITGLGKVWYFDHRGILVIRTPPEPTYPLWTVARGAGGVLVSASRSLSRTGVYNGVLAVGEGLDTEAPARGLAVDSDPASPTLWGGPFGKVPREFASPLITTDGQAQLAAQTILRRSLGLPYNLDLTAIPNPALEPDDPIAVGITGTPRPVAPALLVGDSFSRSVTNGLGTSESGHTWSFTGTPWQVTGSSATLSIATANVFEYNVHPEAAGRRDTDHYLDVRVPNAATGASLVAGIAARFVDSTHHLMLRLEFDPGGLVTLKLSQWNGGFSELAVLPGFAAYTAGQWWTVRGRVRGTGTLEVKAWIRGTPEPADWQLTTEAAPMAGVRSGVWFWRVAGNTNTGAQWEFDNYRALSVPPTLLRGGEIHVIDTLTIPLTADAAMSATTRQQSLGPIGVSS